VPPATDVPPPWDATRADEYQEARAEIRREFGYQDFHEPDVERELAGWLEARSWVGAESHRALFDRASEQLISSKVLLPGASVWRLVGAVRQRAAEPGYELIAKGVTTEERDGLKSLLAVPDGEELTWLELLRHGPVKPSAEGIVNSLVWLGKLRALSPKRTGVDELPAARLRTLLVDARTYRAQQIALMGESRRIATLTAFAAIGELHARIRCSTISTRSSMRSTTARSPASATAGCGSPG